MKIYGVNTDHEGPKAVNLIRIEVTDTKRAFLHSLGRGTWQPSHHGYARLLVTLDGNSISKEFDSNDQVDSSGWNFLFDKEVTIYPGVHEIKTYHWGDSCVWSPIEMWIEV